MEAARELAGRDEHGGVLEVVGVGDRPRADLVVGEQLDRALGAAGRRGDEHDAVAVASRAARISSTQSPIRP